jgi:hypothetical protein
MPSPLRARKRLPTTEQEWFDQGTRDIDRYDGEDGYDADVEEEEEPSKADDESTQNVED